MANKIPGQMMNLLLLMGLDRHTTTQVSCPKNVRARQAAAPHMQQQQAGKLKQQLSRSAASVAGSPVGSPLSQGSPAAAASSLQAAPATPPAGYRGRGAAWPGQAQPQAEGALVMRTRLLQAIEG